MENASIDRERRWERCLLRAAREGNLGLWFRWIDEKGSRGWFVKFGLDRLLKDPSVQELFCHLETWPVSCSKAFLGRSFLGNPECQVGKLVVLRATPEQLRILSESLRRGLPRLIDLEFEFRRGSCSELDYLAVASKRLRRLKARSDSDSESYRSWCDSLVKSLLSKKNVRLRVLSLPNYRCNARSWKRLLAIFPPQTELTKLRLQLSSTRFRESPGRRFELHLPNLPTKLENPSESLGPTVSRNAYLPLGSAHRIGDGRKRSDDRVGTYYQQVKVDPSRPPPSLENLKVAFQIAAHARNVYYHDGDCPDFPKTSAAEEWKSPDQLKAHFDDRAFSLLELPRLKSLKVNVHSREGYLGLLHEIHRRSAADQTSRWSLKSCCILLQGDFDLTVPLELSHRPPPPFEIALSSKYSPWFRSLADFLENPESVRVSLRLTVCSSSLRKEEVLCLAKALAKCETLRKASLECDGEFKDEFWEICANSPTLQILKLGPVGLDRLLSLSGPIFPSLRTLVLKPVRRELDKQKVSQVFRALPKLETIVYEGEIFCKERNLDRPLATDPGNLAERCRRLLPRDLLESLFSRQ